MYHRDIRICLASIVLQYSRNKATPKGWLCFWRSTFASLLRKSGRLRAGDWTRAGEPAKVPPSHSPFLAIGRGEGTKPVGNHTKAPEAYAFRGFFPPCRNMYIDKGAQPELKSVSYFGWIYIFHRRIHSCMLYLISIWTYQADTAISLLAVNASLPTVRTKQE